MGTAQASPGVPALNVGPGASEGAMKDGTMGTTGTNDHLCLAATLALPADTAAGPRNTGTAKEPGAEGRKQTVDFERVERRGRCRGLNHVGRHDSARVTHAFYWRAGIALALTQTR